VGEAVATADLNENAPAAAASTSGFPPTADAFTDSDGPAAIVGFRVWYDTHSSPVVGLVCARHQSKTDRSASSPEGSRRRHSWLLIVTEPSCLSVMLAAQPPLATSWTRRPERGAGCRLTIMVGSHLSARTDACTTGVGRRGAGTGQ
jgi:hypothetical protein